jgi:hypothetical protein
MAHLIERQKQQTQQSNTRPYQAPRLFVYGAMRQLTAGGTGTQNESQSPSQEPFKKP